MARSKNHKKDSSHEPGNRDPTANSAPKTNRKSSKESRRKKERVKMPVEVEDEAMLIEETLEDYECPSECAPFIKCVFCGKLLVGSSEEILGAKLLLCFHSACKTCVSTSSWPNDVQKNCPSCEVSLAKDLLDNKILQEIVAEPQPESLQKGMCGMHQDAPANRWCMECSGLVCDYCVEAHKSLMSTREHKIVDADEAPLLLTDTSLVRFACNDHPSMTLDVYCTTCEQMTCRDCQLERHKQHNYQFISELTKDLKKILSRKEARIKMTEEEVMSSQKATEETKNEMRKHKAQLQKELDEHFTKLKEAIDTRYRELKVKLDSLINEEIKSYEASIAHNQKIMSPIKHSLDVLRLILFTVSDPAVIYSQQHLKKCLQLLLYQKERLLIDSNSKKTFKFNCPEQSFQEIVQRLKNFGDFPESSKPPPDHGVYLQLFTQEIAAHERSIAAGTLPNPSPARISLKTVPTGSLQSPEAIRDRNSSDSPSNRRSVDGSPVPRPVWHRPVEPNQSQSAAQCQQKRVPNQDITIKGILRNDNSNTTNHQARQNQAQSQVFDTTITPVSNQLAPTSQPTMVMSQDQSIRYMITSQHSTQQIVQVPVLQTQLQSAIQQTNQLSLQHPPQQQMASRSPTGIAPPPPYIPSPYTQINQRQVNRLLATQAYQQQQQQQRALMTQQMQHQGQQQNQAGIQEISYFPGSTHNPYSLN